MKSDVKAMKLSELRKCDGCGGQLINNGTIQFFAVDVHSAIVNQDALNTLLSLTQMYRGSVGLAAVMSPHGEDVAAELPPVRLLLCFECYCKPQSLASLTESRVNVIEEAERKKEAQPVG